MNLAQSRIRHAGHSLQLRFDDYAEFDLRIQFQNRRKRTAQTTGNSGGYDKTQYETKRVWATARDGVKVPVSIVMKKGTKLDGKSPMLLYAYGSYGASMTPSFSTARLSLVDRGMIYAIAHIRGGGNSAKNGGRKAECSRK
jgi:protease II